MPLRLSAITYCLPPWSLVAWIWLTVCCTCDDTAAPVFTAVVSVLTGTAKAVLLASANAIDTAIADFLTMSHSFLAIAITLDDLPLVTVRLLKAWVTTRSLASSIVEIFSLRACSSKVALSELFSVVTISFIAFASAISASNAAFTSSTLSNIRGCTPLPCQ